MIDSETQSLPRLPPKSRRHTTWEPIYESTEKWEPTLGPWNDATSNGRKRLSFNWGLTTQSETFKKHIFTECDFRGVRDKNESTFVFNECTFSKCDFSLSIIKNCKFTMCEFSECSFSLCTFENVIFRNCKWRENYFSGGATKWVDTYLSNPIEFIGSHFVATIDTNGEKLPKAGLKNSQTHSKRTQATTARNLFRSHSTTGEEEGYYESVQATYVMEAKARLAEHLDPTSSSLYRPSSNTPWNEILRYPKTVSLYIDIMLVRYFGYLNKWGWSVSRPIASLAVTAVLFGAIYYILGYFGSNFWVALGRSAEISTIAGYTRSSTTEMSIFQRTLEIAQLCISLSIHSVLFATVMARVSRVK